ncbi:MAG TPA: HU family DNA-binding protein, partial [Anaerolineales bacterium]|nr:HU family DNA-binding protein [Anaerolineales bacterium]
VVYRELKAENEVVIPGLVKLTAVTKPAVPEREGINPFTKEKTMFKAKPESRVIKPRPVKALKDAI